MLVCISSQAFPVHPWHNLLCMVYLQQKKRGSVAQNVTTIHVPTLQTNTMNSISSNVINSWHFGGGGLILTFLKIWQNIIDTNIQVAIEYVNIFHHRQLICL